MKNFSKQNLITLILAFILVLISFTSLFVGVIDISLKDLFVKNENFNSLWTVFFCFSIASPFGTFVYWNRNERRRAYYATTLFQ